MSDDGPLKNWARELRPKVYGDPRTDESAHLVEIDVRDQSGMQLRDIPEVLKELRFLNAGLPQGSYSIDIQGVCPETVYVEMASEATHLRFDVETGTAKSLHIQMPDPSTHTLAVAMDKNPPLELSLEGGSFNVRGPSYPARLKLTNTSLESKVREVVWLYLNGAVSTRELVAKNAVIGDEVSIRSDGSLTFAEILSLVSGPCSLSVAAKTLHFEIIPQGSTITSEGTSIQIGRPNNKPTIEALHIQGHGPIQVYGQLVKPVFSPDDGAIEVALNGEISEGSGEIVLIPSVASVCTGAPSDPLKLRSINEDCTGAEIVDVDIYQLTIGDVARMTSVERLSPWFPPSRKDALERERRMRFNLHGTHLAEGHQMRELAHFWTRLASLLKDKHASGTSQSRARYAAMHWRREAARGVERALLEAYKRVGYGERVMLPLILLTGLAAALALAVTGTDDYLGAFWYMLRTPLAVFRAAGTTEDAPRVEGFLEDLALLTMKVLGLLLLFFSISAARRIAKAE